MTSIADSLAPEVLEQLGTAFRQSLDEVEAIVTSGYNDIEDTVEQWLGFTTGEYLWDTLWRFGIIVDDDLSWYVPDDFDTTIPLVSLDTPPKAA